MLKVRSTTLSFVMVTALFGTLGCGSEELKEPKPNTASGNDDQTAEDGDRTTFDETVTPPKEYYDALFANAVSRADTLTLADRPQVLWVNFEGATVRKGFGSGESFILCDNTTDIPAPSLSAADKAAITQAVQSYYVAAGAAITTTATKPTGGDFTTMHVGGSYSDLGCSGGQGILGVAPFDVDNVNRNDVGFAFVPSFADARLIGDTVAHEAGHSFGLDHVETRTDLMFASAGANMTGFGVSKIVGTSVIQDAPAILQRALGVASGSKPATPPAAGTPTIQGINNLPASMAGLPGLGQISSINQLLADISAGNVVDVSKLLPQLQALLGNGAGNLPGLDKILTVISAASQAGSGQQGGIGGLPIDPALAGQILQAALGGAGGFGGVAGGLLGGLLGGTTGGTSGGTTTSTGVPSQLTTLLDLSQVLTLGANIPNLPSLLSGFINSAKVINGNFGGANQAALLSLLKVAYAQQMIQLP